MEKTLLPERWTSCFFFDDPVEALVEDLAGAGAAGSGAASTAGSTSSFFFFFFFFSTSA